MSLRQAKILWNPRQDEPKSVKVDESSWLFVKTLMTLSATAITLKAGTKEYALEAGGDSVGAAQGAADSRRRRKKKAFRTHAQKALQVRCYPCPVQKKRKPYKVVCVTTKK